VGEGHTMIRDASEGKVLGMLKRLRVIVLNPKYHSPNLVLL